MDEIEEQIIALIDAIEHKIIEDQHGGLSEFKRLEVEYLVHEIVESYKFQPVDGLIQEAYDLLDTF